MSAGNRIEYAPLIRTVPWIDASKDCGVGRDVQMFSIAIFIACPHAFSHNLPSSPDVSTVLHKSEIDARLSAIEAEIPDLRRDMNKFYRAFEERADRLCCEVDPAHHDYVLNALNAIVGRAGINA